MEISFSAKIKDYLIPILSPIR